MAEAKLSVYEAELRASMIGGVLTIARRRATNAVKRQLRDRGLKVSHFSAKEISVLAEEYFAQHPELINEAATVVERLRVEGYLGKRAQAVRNPPRSPRPPCKSLQLMHSAPRAEPQGFSVCKTHAKWRGAMIVGYARVSTDGQTLDAQQAALIAAGAERVFAEKVSGAVSDRKALARCMAALEAGDVLLVTKLDRLARSTRDLLNTLDAIGKAGAGFKSLGDPWADTTTPQAG